MVIVALALVGERTRLGVRAASCRRESREKLGVRTFVETRGWQRLVTGVLARGSVVHLVCAGALLWPAPGAETAKAPNFAPDSLTCWQLLDDEFIPPPSGPGPIVSDPGPSVHQLL